VRYINILPECLPNALIEVVLNSKNDVQESHLFLRKVDSEDAFFASGDSYGKAAVPV
jgi:hypothetical protein